MSIIARPITSGTAETANGINGTVVQAMSDSDVMLCLQSYQGLRIDRSLGINLIRRINTQAIYRFALAQAKCTS